MKKSLVFLILGVIFVIGLIIFFIGFQEREIDTNLKNKVDSTKNNEDSEEKTEFFKENNSENESTETELIAGGGSGGGAGGEGGGGETEDSLDINEEGIPEDINTQPCGYYFSEYGICNGTCETGECVQEDRSCYCKE